MRRNRQNLFLTLFFLISFDAFSVSIVPYLGDEGVLEKDNHGKMATDVNYSEFTGRVTDRDESKRVLKIYVENNNTRFFKAGDNVEFIVNTKEDKRPCQGNVRGIEDNYFIIYVRNFHTCHDKGSYFRRGTLLNFKAPVLAERIYEATNYREILVTKKEDFLRQLSKINNFLWTYDEQKLKLASEYDEKIVELTRQKQLALGALLQKKEENLILQTKLGEELSLLDENLNHYRIDRREFITDRFNMDHDLGIPLSTRPQEIKEK